MIVDEFREQVSRHPDRIAVRAWDDELSYQDLAARAESLAGRLWRAGVRPGSVVGLDLDRSAAAVSSMIAVLSVGGAYLALSPGDPPLRRQAIMRTAGARTVVTMSDRVAAVPRSATAVAVDTDDGPSGGSAPPDVVDRGDAAAYVAFTSGSTGSPKGVVVPRRAIARLVRGVTCVPIHPDDVFLHFAPLAFDASTWEVWGALLNGACVVVPPPDMPPSRLPAFVRISGVTVLWLTAGLFHQVVDSGLDDLAEVRYLLAGGDVLAPARVSRALAALPDTVLVNGYGPTENTTFTCCHRITDAIGAIPIGRPIAGTTVHVLDDLLRPVAGDTGELYAGGLGVAHGYLGDPRLTAERFVPDPYAPVSGARMYRTGDRVRLDRNSDLEFLGRTDGQVKVRGFRVDLTEVEQSVATAPGVDLAAVVARRDRFDDNRLVAFVVGSIAPPDLRRHLVDVLPDHAVPALIVRRDELRLTANGKIDRAALAESQQLERPELRAAYRPPDTDLEQAVVQLWADLMAVDGVGADDDFFELGGHSLLGVRILTDLWRTYGVDVPPLTFYLEPTPAGLARAVTAMTSAGNSGAP
jgi:amino acid adenylation domain-containing protein